VQQLSKQAASELAKTSKQATEVRHRTTRQHPTTYHTPRQKSSDSLLL